MSMDLQELMNGLFLLIGILGIMKPLGQAAGSFPTDWGVVAMVAIPLALFHFVKIFRTDNVEKFKPGDKYTVEGGARLWNW